MHFIRNTPFGNVKPIAVACARRLFATGLAGAVLLAGYSAASMADGAEWRFSVRFAPTVHNKPFTGRVYIFFNGMGGEPRRTLNWFRPETVLARDVANWKPGATIEFSRNDKSVLAYPGTLEKFDPAGERAQAVVRFNPLERTIGDAPGNGYSQVITVPKPGPGSDPAGETQRALLVDQLVPARIFSETEWRKEFRVRSQLLSNFYGRDVFLSAAVVLPASYQSSPSRRYPTMFTVPGFGGTHYSRVPGGPIHERNRNGVEFLRVYLDPSCPLGHHVFADSQNNGPVGQGLLTEFMPAYERAFRSISDPRARFLTGHSSGGWSTLWLQITYPNEFGGTWSTSPDPVDFRDFQRIDLYRPGQNLYVDSAGHERPVAHYGQHVLLTFRGFAMMEQVLGPGEQLHSFEAVFSPRGRDGKPRLLWDRKTGAIDLDVAKSWEKYDIRLTLERNWKTLGPKLAGKIHVFTGSEDTFYLEGAVRLLKESLAKLGSDAVIEIHPGKDHGTLLDAEMLQRIRSEMVEAYLKALPQ